MRQTKMIEELSITDLFNKQAKYIIPIYQRNYAWEETEIEQLLQDVLDSIELSDLKDYYLGSLVVYQRDNDCFETIDGQQRHTTLAIILSVLKNKFLVNIKDITLNIGFDSRPESVKTLGQLFDKGVTDEGVVTIRSAYEITQKFLSKNFLFKDKDKITIFSNYLLEHVKLLRVVVPKDTDLNHYFEIMNNRGEQLEKHEVLKARFMSELNTNKERNVFATVWEACAEMERYVQLGIKADIREKIFGDQWDNIPDDFNELCNHFEENDTNEDCQSMESIITSSISDNKQNKQKGNEQEDAQSLSGSIINFSNFLLHVLRVTTKEDIPLDDKRLLDSFTKYCPDAHQFTLDLLHCRLLFDRYIIKRKDDKDWHLHRLKIYTNKSYNYVNTFADERQNRQLIMLLSMFHVSFPTLVYKHWLSAALSYLYDDSRSQKSINAEDYIAKLENISNRFFYGRFGISDIDYYRLTFESPDTLGLSDKLACVYLEQGTNVQNFIFNRLDYLLWKKLVNNERFDGVDIEYVKKRLSNFHFTFRASVEHYFPQNPLSGDKLVESFSLPKGVDTFGNLCLISSSKNSKLSNYLPEAKKEHYENSTTIESLKQVFMMSYKKWGSESEQATQNIVEHEAMMIKVLCS